MSDTPGNAEIPAESSADRATGEPPVGAPDSGLPHDEQFGAGADPSPSSSSTLPQPEIDSGVHQPPAFPNYGFGSFGHPTSETAPLPHHTVTQTRTDSPRRRGGVAVVAALALGAVIGGASGAGISIWAIGQNTRNAPATASGPSTITVKNADDANLVTAVAAKASPSVVTISASGGSSAGTGSGVILTADGYVLTNTHVVTLDGSSNSASIRVTDATGRSYSAKLIGTDPIADLAVVKIQGASGFTPIEFGDSSDLTVGDTVVAIGAPLGLSGTVTNGIVSALNRGITVASAAAPDDKTGSNNNDGNGFRFDIPGQTPKSASSTIALSVIQTDAAINPGNSGGALVDDQGRLIGINVAIASTSNTSATAGNIGVGFSIPSNYAKRIADELIASGTASHGLLGASVGAAPSSSDSSSTPAGAYISGVTSGGAAANAGLAQGDIVTSFNGATITNATDLTAQVRMLAAGSKAELTYVRGGQNHTVSVTLGKFSS